MSDPAADPSTPTAETAQQPRVGGGAPVPEGRSATTQAADMTVLPLSREEIRRRGVALAQPEPGTTGVVVEQAEEVFVGDALLPSLGGFVHVDTGPPTEAPLNIEVPHVSGVGSVGQTLSCTTGIWDNTPDTYAYQWQSDGSNVGSDADTYLVDATDAGHAITCIVTATNAIGSTAAPPSDPVQIT